MRRFPYALPLLAILIAAAGCKSRYQKTPLFLVTPNLLVPPLRVASFVPLEPPPPAILLTTELAAMLSPFPLPEIPPPPRRRVVGAKGRTSPPDQSEPATDNPAEPPRLPQLGPVLSDAERQRLVSGIDQNLASAEKSLALLGARRLTAAQRAEAERVRNIIEQARALRSVDPAQARSLAERAAVLARDLARR